jgi:hypothetical protein
LGKTITFLGASPLQRPAGHFSLEQWMNNANKSIGSGTTVRISSRGCLAPLAAALALVTVAGTAQASAELQFTPSVSEVAVGEVFELVLGGVGFDQTADGKTIGNVTGGQNLNFSFSNALLEVISTTIDPSWTFASGNRPGVIDQAAGTLTGMAFGTFPATTNDSFNIASFSVRALAPGAASLTLLSAQLIGVVDGRSGQLITADLGQAVISVVPEPGQWALMIAGLGFIALKLRRN